MPNPQTLTVAASDIATTTLSNRSKEIQDGILNSVGLLEYLSKQSPKSYRPFSGGIELREEVSYAQNNSFKMYSGLEKLDTTQNDTLTYFVFDIKQAAVAVIMSGLEEAQNAGEDAVIDLMESRIGVAESTMQNQIGGAVNGVYSAGTGTGGKGIGGIQQLISTTPTTGIVGGINRATAGNEFARNGLFRAITDGGAAKTSANIKRYFNRAKTISSRNQQRPDVAFCDSNDWGLIQESASARQLIADSSKVGKVGFEEIYFEGVRVRYDGGFGGSCPANTTYIINSGFLYWRPHAKRNMVPLKKREGIDQDASISYLVWYGNMTFNTPFLHSVLTNT
jgi:hypothetical protein